MSQLKDTLTDAIKVAMKAREMDKIKVLRGVQAAIKKIEIDTRTELDDAGVLDVLQKQIKQRQESLTIYKDNGRDDLAQKEQFEIDVISAFMPAPFSEDELTALVKDTIAKLGATGMADMGKVMGELKTLTVGRADPALVSKLVKAALAG